jgi:hypothetical protein
LIKYTKKNQRGEIKIQTGQKLKKENEQEAFDQIFYGLSYMNNVYRYLSLLYMVSIQETSNVLIRIPTRSDPEPYSTAYIRILSEVINQSRICDTCKEEKNWKKKKKKQKYFCKEFEKKFQKNFKKKEKEENTLKERHETLSKKISLFFFFILSINCKTNKKKKKKCILLTYLLLMIPF